jgi:peptidyl-tRNA hydrolase, PTH1 family
MVRRLDMESVHLIVGLGNPGAEYAQTHHNAGFMLVERLLRRWQAEARLEEQFQASMARIDREGWKAWVCLPQTYMNASGVAVRKVKDYFRITLNRMLVLVDDADLPLGEIRLRPAGGSGGHHGLESIEAHLGTQSYPRLRLGIGRNSSTSRQIKDYVLSRFRPEEMALLAAMLDRAEGQVNAWLTAGIQMAMNQFNGAVRLQEQRKAE